MHRLLVRLFPGMALARAERLREQGHSEAAIEHYADIVGELAGEGETPSPSHQNVVGRALLGIARAKWGQNRQLEAVEDYRTAQQLGIWDTEFCRRLSHWCFEQGAYADGAKLLEASRQRTLEESILLSRCYLKGGRYTDAVWLLSELASEHAGELEPLYYLGCAYGWSSDYEQARRILSSAIALSPSARAYRQRGHSLLKLGRYRSALEDYRSAERLGDAGSVARDYARLAECLYRDGQWDLLEELSATRPSVEIVYWCALACVRQGKSHEARRKLLDAAGMSSDHRESASLLAALVWRDALRVASDARWRETADLLSQLFSEDGGSVARWTPAPAAEVHRWAAVAFLRAGRLPVAMCLLERSVRLGHSDRWLVHSAGLSSFLLAHQLTQCGQPREADRCWDVAFAVLGMILEDDRFWEEYRSCAEARYGCDVFASDMDFLRREIQRFLSDVASHGLDGTLDVHDKSARGRSFRLHHELASARLLRQCGGLAEGHGSSVVGGLRMIRLLGEQRRIGKLCAAKTDETRRLMRSFSSLGLAQWLVDSNSPSEALEALAQSACPRCRAARQQNPDTGGVVVCAQDCPDFDVRNPAFSALPDKSTELFCEACQVAADAHLEFARQALSSADGGLDRVCRSWRESLRLAEIAGDVQPVKQQGIETVLGRVAGLQGKGEIDPAILLVEAACSVFEDSELWGCLAALLTDRGVTRGNTSPPDFEGATEDLRRAAKLNPHSPRARSNLGIAMQSLAAQLSESGRREQAMLLFHESLLLQSSPGRHNHDGANDADGQPLQNHDSRAEELVREALKLAKEPATLLEAARLMEEAFRYCPQLRKEYESRLQLWRRGISM